jgi:NAD(P)-dependent dehydrogenase (short-subunit alcohol dehydrogenase family)
VRAVEAARKGADAILELSVVGSFSRLGPALRQHLFDWQAIDGHAIRGQVAVVTGATSGLGLECATALARLGARVIVLVRNAELGSSVCATITQSTSSGDVSMIVADLGDLDSVRRAAKELNRLPAIHILIHNAGTLSKTFEVTAEGIERTAAVQLIGPFLLTSLIRDRLQSGCARVVWVTSGGMYAEPLDVDWLEAPSHDYDGVRAYAKVKRAQVSLNETWAPRLEPLDITMTAMHPGWVDTPGLRRSLPTFARLLRAFLRSPAQGVDTILWLVTTSSSPSPGSLWLDRRARSAHRLQRTKRSDTVAQRERLWHFCVERAGLDVPFGRSR